MESVNCGIKPVKHGMKAANRHIRFSRRCNGKAGYAYDIKIHLQKGFFENVRVKEWLQTVSINQK